MKRYRIDYFHLLTTKAMTIEDIFNVGHIGVRSFNVCDNNGLKSLEDILDYYKARKSFGHLRNCGKKSNEELTALCLKFRSNGCISHSSVSEPRDLIMHNIANMTDNQKEIVHGYIEINLTRLSKRSKNALASLLGGNLDVPHLTETLFARYGIRLREIKNVGAKTVVELNDFVESVGSFIKEVSSAGADEDLARRRSMIFLKETSSMTEIPFEVLEVHSIFLTVDFMLSQKLVFKGKQNGVFMRSMMIYENQPEFTADEIALEFELCRERVNQLRKACLNEFFEEFKFIKDINEDLLGKYGVDLNSGHLVINSDLQRYINQVNGTGFSKAFITLLVYVSASDHFQVIGRFEDVLHKKCSADRTRHNWKNLVLAKADLVNDFDFFALANGVCKRLSLRIEETYTFDFDSYLLEFFKSKDVRLLGRISPVAETIINLEFGLCLDADRRIIFERNTIKQVPEYAVEALEELGRPSSIIDIYALVERNYPGVTKSAEALRGSLNRARGIIYFGRSSTYGLKIWEEEAGTIKGGTIRQIVAEYLERYQEPKALSDITSYVLQYRPTTSDYSIIQNLKLDASGVFMFYQNTYVGLSSKIYGDAFSLLEDDVDKIIKRTWQERFDDLVSFVILNARLPFSSGCPDEEVRLYRWHRIQYKKLNDSNLDDEKSRLLNVIYDSLLEKQIALT